jgi:hypothetical protein
MIKHVFRFAVLGMLLSTPLTANPAPTPEQVLADASRYTVKVQVLNEIALNQDDGGAAMGTGFLIDKKRGWLLRHVHPVLSKYHSGMAKSLKQSVFMLIR